MRSAAEFTVVPDTVHLHRRGAALVYSTIAMFVLIAFAVLAVDAGRLILARAQLQDAADAAARYAAIGLVSSSTPQTTAQQHAAAVLSTTKVDGGTLSAANYSVTVGKWNEITRVFTATTNAPNAVKVDLAFKLAEAGRPKLFASVVGAQSDNTMRSSSIATASVGSQEFNPPASGNLWLSTAAPGTVNKNFRDNAPHVWDYAGSAGNARQSPLEIQLDDLNLNPGDALSFEGLSGTAIYVSNGGQNSADGVSNFIVALGQTYPGSVPTNNYNGMSNVRAPIGAIMAVFLTDDPASTGPAPAALDFNTANQRNYSTLSPQVKQVFFVGDGKRDNGEVQRIVVPDGATRALLGMMDAWQWNDNVGNFKFNIYGRKNVTTVK